MYIYCNLLFNALSPTGSLDRVVGTATSYGLEDRGVGVRVPVVVETGSGVYRASYLMGTGDPFLRNKAAGA
jgi:hypothetical protein